MALVIPVSSSESESSNAGCFMRFAWTDFHLKGEDVDSTDRLSNIVAA